MKSATGTVIIFFYINRMSC